MTAKTVTYERGAGGRLLQATGEVLDEDPKWVVVHAPRPNSDGYVTVTKIPIHRVISITEDIHA